jgi:hypothetical protein
MILHVYLEIRVRLLTGSIEILLMNQVNSLSLLSNGILIQFLIKDMAKLYNLFLAYAQFYLKMETFASFFFSLCFYNIKHFH